MDECYIQAGKTQKTARPGDLRRFRSNGGANTRTGREMPSSLVKYPGGPMPKTYFKIYPGRQLVSIHWAGVPSVEEWYKMIELVLGHPDYRRGMSFITYRAGSHKAITATYVRGVLQALELRSQWMMPLNIAMVAPAAATFGMARMAETLAESTTICLRAFKRTREAMQWLDAPRAHVHGGFHASRQLAVAV